MRSMKNNVTWWGINKVFFFSSFCLLFQNKFKIKVQSTKITQITQWKFLKIRFVHYHSKIMIVIGLKVISLFDSVQFDENVAKHQRIIKQYENAAKHQRITKQ